MMLLNCRLYKRLQMLFRRAFMKSDKGIVPKMLAFLHKTSVIRGEFISMIDHWENEQTIFIFFN